MRDYMEPVSGVHPTIRKFTRAGYADFIAEDRDWGVLHRIWPGTNVLLLAGDPALAASYSKTTAMLGTLGIERVDPLGFKGRKGSGYPGGRCAYADKSLEPKWDFQKFLYTYRVWGRLLYNPETDPEVWKRFMRSKFGEAAEPMEIALANSSRVVHLITTAHGPATDCTRFWPEMYTSQPIVNETDEGIFSDNYPKPRVFGNVSPHDSQLFSKMNEFAISILKGNELAKYSPLHVAQWLEDMADIATLNLNKATTLVEDKSDVEFRRFYHDIKIQCGTAKFFANKMRAAVLWHVYEESGNRSSLVEAIKYYTTARQVWVKMANDAKLIYVENVSFGNWETQSGHWIKRIPRIDADIADMKEVLVNSANNRSENKKYVSKAVETVKTRPHLPTVKGQHIPDKNFQPGKSMKVALNLEDDASGVLLYYRHVNQAVAWKSVPMNKNGNEYSALIPEAYTKTRYSMQYYFGIDMGKEGKAIYPGLDSNLGGMPYYVIHQKKLAIGDSKVGELQSLFNGTTLEGWHVDCLEKDKGKNYWRVAEGTIECYSMGDKDHDYIWLSTDKEYENFELTLKFQSFRDNIGNSGVQVHSRYDTSPDAPRGGWLDGPQVDIHPRNPWRNGLVYDETRDERGWLYPKLRGVVIKREHIPLLKDKDIIFKYNDEGDGWNDMKIICNGTRLKSIVNGVVICDQDFAGIFDSDAHKKYNVGMDGKISFQIHTGAQVNMRFKDIIIKEKVASKSK
jgi:hypothetical protein